MKMEQNFEYKRNKNGNLIRIVVSEYPIMLLGEKVGTTLEEVKQVYTSEGEVTFLNAAKGRMKEVFDNYSKLKKEYDLLLESNVPDFDSELMERLVNGFHVIKEELDLLKQSPQKAKFGKLAEMKIDNLESVAARASHKFNLKAKLAEHEKMANLIKKEVEALKKIGTDLSEMIPSEFSDTKN